MGRADTQSSEAFSEKSSDQPGTFPTVVTSKE
jgi:hypothetical protein